MVGRWLDRSAERGESHPWRGVAGILLVGAALGAMYNGLGLRSSPAWGLSWIAEDRMALLAEAPSVTAAVQTAPETPGTPVGDDPLSIPASAVTLPEIPGIGRPVQIELGAVKQYVDAGAALIADAREPEEYLAGHIPGAVNLPYDQVVSDPARIEALETGGRPIITYCGGGSCEQSLSLADELFFAGHDRVAVFMGGFPQWVAAGHGVETGSEPGGGSR